MDFPERFNVRVVLLRRTEPSANVPGLEWLVLQVRKKVAGISEWHMKAEAEGDPASQGKLNRLSTRE